MDKPTTDLIGTSIFQRTPLPPSVEDNEPILDDDDEEETLDELSRLSSLFVVLGRANEYQYRASKHLIPFIIIAIIRYIEIF